MAEPGGKEGFTYGEAVEYDRRSLEAGLMLKMPEPAARAPWC